MERLINQIFSKNKMVVITGAGISTLSGLPDFRGNNGLYKKYSNAHWKLSIECLREEPDEFYEFYKKNLMLSNISTNVIHNTLSTLQDGGYIDYIITQNIDGLHQKAGSKNIVELHGNGEIFYCNRCNELYDAKKYITDGYICEKCSGIIRPDIVLYGETVKLKNRLLALKKILASDIVLVLGSSLTVSTINNLLEHYIKTTKIVFNSQQLIIINENETPYDKYATKYSDDLENVFQKIKIYNEKRNKNEL